MQFKTLALLGALFIGASAGTAQASLIPYPNTGTANPTLYSFTATGGEVKAYFVSGGGAGFTNILGLEAGGVDTGVNGLNNHTSNPGDSLSFGVFAAGTSLVFYIDTNGEGGNRYYSDKSRNADNFNHIYSVTYNDGSLPASIPFGTYVAFEDLKNGGDKNYNDLAFVFVNVQSGVPEPSTWAMMLIGFAGLAVATRRRREAIAAV
ncbi:MAG: PEPxxWA-CTERM sorting domain-containing protein [Methylobacteriaceae bacterium]|nr:PEPxxWA-CTERM sorting domain-containing protein [Methylobacteriaceae bacterium]